MIPLLFLRDCIEEIKKLVEGRILHWKEIHGQALPTDWVALKVNSEVKEVHIWLEVTAL